MKVSELIKLLQDMPQDAEVIQSPDVDDNVYCSTVKVKKSWYHLHHGFLLDDEQVFSDTEADLAVVLMTDEDKAERS